MIIGLHQQLPHQPQDDALHGLLKLTGLSNIDLGMRTSTLLEPDDNNPPSPPRQGCTQAPHG